MNILLEQVKKQEIYKPNATLRVASKKNISVDNVQVYPNPFKDQFQISILNETSQYIDIKITDATDTAWISKRTFLEQGYQVINIDTGSHLSPGLYLYQLHLGAQIIQGKLTKVI